MLSVKTSEELRESLPAWTQEPGRVAIVHDWLTGMRGGEAILEVICELFPKADLVTLLQTDFKMSRRILNGRRIRHSFLQFFMRLPRFAKGYRQLLPFFPKAIESINMEKYDLILSTSHCVAKGVKKRSDALHMAYIHSPVRYMWDRFDDYFGAGRSGFLTTHLATRLRPWFQKWDRESTVRVNKILANSHTIQERIRQCWGRESTVIFPFVQPGRFTDHFEEPKDYFLILSALVPYKRIDIAVEAFCRMQKRLVIIGKGQEEERLKALAKDAPWIEFHGALSDEAIGQFYRKAQAFIFPGLEDFGITPLESLYNGRPVIAYNKGGLLDTITDHTGVFFPAQTAESLIEAVQRFEAREFHPEDCRARALEFSRERFQKEYLRELLELLNRSSI